MTPVGAERHDAWRGARLLEALSETGPLPPRYRALVAAGAVAGLDFEDIGEAARWPTAGPGDLPNFLCCVAAAAHAAAWRRIVDGDRLRRLAAVVSEPVLEAVFSLDPLSLPIGPQGAEDVGDREAFADLGRRLLLASLPSAAQGEAADHALARAAVDLAGVLYACAARQHA